MDIDFGSAEKFLPNYFTNIIFFQETFRKVLWMYYLLRKILVFFKLLSLPPLTFLFLPMGWNGIVFFSSVKYCAPYHEQIK